MTCLSQVSSANRASEGACLWKLSPARCQLNPTPQFSTLQEASRKPAWGSTPEGRSLVAWLVCLMPTPSPFCLQLAALSSWPGPSWQALAGTQAVQSLPGLTVLTIEAVVPTLCQVPACKKKGRVSTQRHCTLQGSRGTRSACLTKPFCGSRTEWRLGCSKSPWKFLQGMAGVVPPPPIPPSLMQLRVAENEGYIYHKLPRLHRQPTFLLPLEKWLLLFSSFRLPVIKEQQ